MSKRPLPFTLLALALATGSARAADLSALDVFVRANQAKYGIPGLAVGIVQNGKLIYAKGFGFRDVEKKLPVTPRTLFGLGSTSKAFAGVTVAAMVDDGRIRLDEPVKTYLDDFDLDDETAAGRATVRDLLLHRTGQARHDTMWLGTPFNRTEIFKRLGFFAFNLDFREKWQYSNLMYMAAGHLAERVGGTTWENLVQTRIFRPLGMNASNTSVNTSREQKDFAEPYKTAGNSRVKRGFRVVDNMGPAASVNSNLEDMAHWLNYQIDGRVNGDGHVLSDELRRETQRGQIAVPGESYDDYAEFTPTEYGFAWKVQRYRGTLLRRHGGDIGGFLTTVAVLPEINAGVVVLQNIDSFGLNNYVALRAYDLLLGKAPIDWIGRLNSPAALKGRTLAERPGLAPALNESTEEEHLFVSAPAGTTVRERIRSLDERPAAGPLPLASYVGTYEDEAYGTLKISLVSGQLRLAYNDWTAALRPSSGHVFTCSGGFSKNATFTVDAQNQVVRVALPFESTVAPITFEAQ